MYTEDQIQDLKKELADKEKKIKLAEFRSNKAIKEHTLLLETEKIKFQESQEMCTNLQKQVKDLMEKNIEADKIILKLREEIYQRKETKSHQYDSDDENSVQKLQMPRIPMIQSIEIDLSQLVKMIQNQSGDNSALQEEAMKIVESLQNQINTLQQDLNLSDLRIAELTKSQSGQDAGLELQLQNLYDEFEGFRKKTDVEKYDLQRKIKNLSEQIDDIRQKNAIDYEQFQDQLRNEFELKNLENEHQLNKQKSELLMDLDNNEEKLRQYEIQINEMNNHFQHKIDQLENIHKQELQQKNYEISQLNELQEKNMRSFREQLQKQNEDLNNHNQKIVRDLKFQIDYQQLINDDLNKKNLRFEQEISLKNSQLKDQEQYGYELKNELQIKNDQIDLIQKEYEQKIQQQQIDMSMVKNNYEKEIQQIHDSYELHINEIETNNNISKNSSMSLQFQFENEPQFPNFLERDLQFFQAQEEIKQQKQENELLNEKVRDMKIEFDAKKEAFEQNSQDLEKAQIKIIELENQLIQTKYFYKIYQNKIANQLMDLNSIPSESKEIELQSQINDLQDQVEILFRLKIQYEIIISELNQQLMIEKNRYFRKTASANNSDQSTFIDESQISINSKDLDNSYIQINEDKQSKYERKIQQLRSELQNQEVLIKQINELFVSVVIENEKLVQQINSYQS